MHIETVFDDQRSIAIWKSILNDESIPVGQGNWDPEDLCRLAGICMTLTFPSLIKESTDEAMDTFNALESARARPQLESLAAKFLDVMFDHCSHETEQFEGRHRIASGGERWSS